MEPLQPPPLTSLNCSKYGWCDSPCRSGSLGVLWCLPCTTWLPWLKNESDCSLWKANTFFLWQEELDLRISSCLFCQSNVEKSAWSLLSARPTPCSDSRLRAISVALLTRHRSREKRGAGRTAEPAPSLAGKTNREPHCFSLSEFERPAEGLRVNETLDVWKLADILGIRQHYLDKESCPPLTHPFPINKYSIYWVLLVDQFYLILDNGLEQSILTLSKENLRYALVSVFFSYVLADALF